MEHEKCPKCGGREFEEGSDFVGFRKNKISLKYSFKIYRFCVNCGEVVSIRIENPEIFKKQ
ncbi:hypothetical protein NST62_00800 [Ureibacillus sp. FSL K6-8385]|uniref:Transcription initiation factor TFIIIB n=1 Tax=Ureibacillus terrenus TaxID=118246 RepID=A0A540V5K7_9BACL|nr:hypothetical protein [Ureibacillus terrenus]MED3661203.1 hypothetical protein [Ureibacillus terrenus]MED3764322.1 hypothetical protein [Ureibacillus terrenus]TQE91998.1 hypothetical protein FKZ59_02600 [Ureibacillus terrenus]